MEVRGGANHLLSRGRRAARLCFVVVLCASAAACGRGTATPTAMKSEAATFSADDRRAARRLSIDARQDLTAYASPYLRAVVCEAAIIKLQVLLDRLDAIGPEQKSALAKARDIYGQRVLSAARLERKSAKDVDIDRRARQQPTVDRSVELQAGLTCLRELAVIEHRPV